ncbi:MAG: lipoate--protein ligase [Clostridia bacterium]|nr:lipoate--protein ligase [Clostridia bacterium]
MNKLLVCVSDSFDPYFNQGLEKHLLEQVGTDSLILYLWQNDRTVVIGRNQDAYAECRITELTNDGGHLARRLSGGGAVFHDKGNLNYTFIAPKNRFDIPLNSEIVLDAVASFGLYADLSGRNDMVIDGRKFSGTAYYRTEAGCLHHGTLLISGDFELMRKYLAVSESKLKKNAVQSVRSRVVNLRELNPAVSVDLMKERLIASFGRRYGAKVELISAPPAVLEREFFENTEWILGRKPHFNRVFECQFPFGNFKLALMVKEGVICDAELYTDAMDAEGYHELCERLKGLPLSKSSIETVFKDESRELIEWLIREVV